MNAGRVFEVTLTVSITLEAEDETAAEFEAAEFLLRDEIVFDSVRVDEIVDDVDTDYLGDRRYPESLGDL